MSPTNQPTKPPTVFQRRVFGALSAVPCGKTTTYGTLARAVGCGSAQAIGQALRRNPDAPRIPCHRVVRNDGSIGGFFGENDPAAVAKKRVLLKAEGVAFDSKGCVKEPFIIRQL